VRGVWTQALLRSMKDRGAVAAELNVMVDNARAQALYARAGFHVARRVPGYYTCVCLGLGRVRRVPVADVCLGL
jgi:RimJ/RimL family protein N-acetyltransferase